MVERVRVRGFPGSAKTRTLKLCWAAAAALALHATGAAVYAQGYPAKPIRIVVPFAVGGGADILARMLGQKFYESMGQTAIVDNRTGAGGNIGAEITARAPPDGYTVLLTTPSMAVNMSLYKKLSYDAIKDLAPVTLVASVPLVLIVHPSVPAKSLKELVALIRSKPSTFNFASNGSGTTSHLSGEFMNLLTNARMTHIPYKGGGPATTAVLSGEVDMTFTTILSASAQIKAGKVRAVAVSTARPSAALPGVPVMSSVLAGFETDNWYGMFVPAATPRDIINKLNGETLKAIKAADVRAYMARDGAEPIGSTPEELARYFAGEVAKYAKLVKASKATVD